jgi:hypothetical protein
MMLFDVQACDFLRDEQAVQTLCVALSEHIFRSSQPAGDAARREPPNSELLDDAAAAHAIRVQLSAHLDIEWSRNCPRMNHGCAVLASQRQRFRHCSVTLGSPQLLDFTIPLSCDAGNVLGNHLVQGWRFYTRTKRISEPHCRKRGL